MEISRDKALELLRLWERQGRTLHCFLYDVAVEKKWRFEASLIVRIERVSEEVLEFDAGSMTVELGKNIAFRLLLDRTKVFFTLDSAGSSPDAYERSFESILGIMLSTASLCKILAPKPTQ